ncbi:MAG: DUF1501 domain-containing protein [Proteobacteria bacterium]|nr:DUF1501 domain-containing protein [Pseudomonadota bacterium]
MLTRRHILQAMGAAMIVGGTNPVRLAFGAAPTENRLAFAILRGGLDGLHALPPHGDRQYYSHRPAIAVPAPGKESGALDLDGYFGLHPSLAPLMDLYRDKQLLMIPAATTSYRQRSHFDGQNVLENGMGKPSGGSDGWLNRALAKLNDGDRRMGLSVGHAIPLLMRGEASVQTWAPSRLPKAGDDFMQRLAYAYQGDDLFSMALRQGRESQQGMPDAMADMSSQQPGGRRQQTKLLAESAGRLLSEPTGPRIAVLEIGGWDTHAGQVNRLQNLLGELSESLIAFKGALGPAWESTTVIVVSEFGRTVAQNGTNGTDHGTGGIAMLLGGAVRGGRIGGDWPGLSDRALLDNRDVRPTTDYRGIFKAALIEQAGLSEGYIEEVVFPGSRGVRPINGLFRTG